MLGFLHELYPLAGTGLLLLFLASLGGIPACFIAWAIGNVHTHDHPERRLPWSQAYKIFAEFFRLLIFATLAFLAFGILSVPSRFIMLVVSAISVVTLVIFWMERLSMLDSMRTMQKTPAPREAKEAKA